MNEVTLKLILRNFGTALRDVGTTEKKCDVTIRLIFCNLLEIFDAEKLKTQFKNI